MQPVFDPYCGPAPLPDEFWSAWNFDPWLLVALAAVFAGARLASERRIADPAGRGWFGLALLVLVVAFVSPLCALSSALFSARVFHHVLLVAVAAPLLALAFPARPGFSRLPLSLLFLGHTILMWVWHAPAPYAFALASNGAYWLMEATLLASAFLMWQVALSRFAHPAAAMATLLGSVLQMGMLGALMTFATRPLYEPHLVTTIPFGLTPLADQQLAGLLMWVPASLPYLIAAGFVGAAILRRPEAEGTGGRAG